MEGFPILSLMLLVPMLGRGREDWQEIGQRLADAGIAMTDLAGVGVGAGPGSFVGVRVGISYVSVANARGNLDAEVEMARAADFVLAGASYLEKDACYTNDKGMVQAAAFTDERPWPTMASPATPRSSAPPYSE